jgi:hypothetical protein
MKVLVMSEDTWMEISGALNDWPEALALIAAKVHPVDIPDGCVLAVVNASMVKERVWDDQFEYAYAPFARVIQEVKL